MGSNVINIIMDFNNLSEGVLIAVLTGTIAIFTTTLNFLFSGIQSYIKRVRGGITENFVLKKQFLQAKVDFLKEYLECQRVSVCMLHNGGDYYSGESIKRLSMVAESLKSGARSSKNETQGISISPYLRNLNPLFHKEYVFEEDTSVIKDVLSEINKEYDIKTVMVIGIFNIKKRLPFFKKEKRMIAFIHIGWDELKDFIHEEELEVIREYTNNIIDNIKSLSIEK